MTRATEDTGAQAARILHEEQVSASVQAAHKQLSDKLWALHYARDYLLGVLQLLEQAHLLRDADAEQQRRDHQRAFGAPRTTREDAYRQLLLRVTAWSGIPGATERLELIEKARDDEEYRQLTRRFESDELPNLVQQWREERRATAEAALGRVRRLLDDKRKTVPMQALRDAVTTDTTQEGQQ